MGSITGVPVAESHCSESCLELVAVAIADVIAAVLVDEYNGIKGKQTKVANDAAQGRTTDARHMRIICILGPV